MSKEENEKKPRVENDEDWRAATATLVVAARKRAGISQAELARRAGIIVSTVCKIEKKGTPLSMHNLYRLAFALECPVHDLVPRESKDAIQDLRKFWVTSANSGADVGR